MKNLDDDDKDICRSFFPPMFGEDGSGNENMNHEEKKTVNQRYLQMKKDFMSYKKKSANNYDYYNMVEEAMLSMENDEGETARISEEQLTTNGITRQELRDLVQQIRILSMQMQRFKPAEWN